MATGTPTARDLKIPGRELKGVYFALEMLSQQNRVLAGMEFKKDELVNAKGKDVLVIGGGDTGSDCIGTAHRQGCKSVTQIEIMPKPVAGPEDPKNPWPEYPRTLKTTSSHEEGCVRRWNINSLEFLGKDGKLTGVRVQEITWKPNPDGGQDANLETDWDMNEVVFLMYGDPKIPDKIEITNDEIKESVTKRYMIEDLGSTDDFDFNDVVVDVTEECTLKITKENGVITKTENVKTEQKAIIRHLGGSLPFTLTIGNTSLPEIQGALNKNPNTEYMIEGWEPDKNNISVTVKGTENDGIHTVNFPANGEIPMIIAVDPTVNWMEERVAITKEWFEGLKK